MTGPGEAAQAVGLAATPVIAALHAAARRPFEDAWDIRSVAEVLTMPGAAAWVFSIEEEPAGFVIVRRAADECEILMVGVVPAHRRSGIGQRLVETALDASGSSGARRAYLEVTEDNAPARAFYEVLGFTAVGRRRGYYRRDSGAVDALVLARELSA